MITDENIKINYLKNFYGYGTSWNVPFYFIGLERGGNQQQESFRAWIKLGMKELIDSKLFHNEISITKYHNEITITAPLFRKLIKIFLTYKNGIVPSLDEIKKYQKDFFGRIGGEIILINISTEANPRRDTPSENRDKFIDERIEYIIKNIKQFQPKFVIIFGKEQFKYWNNHIKFDENFNAKIGNTIIKGIIHPSSQSFKEEYCEKIGISLRNT